MLKSETIANQTLFSDKQYHLRVRRPKIEAPKDYFGPLIYPDDVVGTMVVWARPGATQDDLDKLGFAATNYKNYQELAKQYKISILSQSPGKTV